MRHSKRPSLLRRFLNEDGNATVEFALMVPVLLISLIGAAEIGIMTLRHSMLERALDLTVRDVRLSTGVVWEHDDLRDSICDRLDIIPNCSENLKLEMQRTDPRNWTYVDTSPTCTDRSEDTDSETTFEAGRDNELMMLRACIKYEPFYPTTGLAPYLTQDNAGDIAIVAKSAFVQEPK